MTNDPAAARAFAATGPTVAKAVAEARAETEDEVAIGETFVLDGTFDHGAVRPTPVMLQRRVDKVADVRVTVVGKTIFAIRIVTPIDSPIDFRQTDPRECRYEVIGLPDDTATKLRAYLGAFGLRFGAFDFAEGRDGLLWFLECNPAGQWGWLEPLTGLDITGALVDLLLDPSNA